MHAAQLPDRLTAEAVLLRSRASDDGYSDRLHPAAKTVARMRPEFHRLGITRVAEVTGLDRIGIPVWMAVRPNSRTLAVSQGKGLDDAAAQASAIMEAMELAVAEEPAVYVRWCSAYQLASEGEHAAAMDALLSRGQQPLHEHEAAGWVEGYDLVGRRTAWVPADVVSLDRMNGAQSRFWRSSDGLASGNLLLEAVVHGLCERIERDACALWVLRSDHDVLERCVAPESLDDPAVLGLRARVEDAGFQLRLFDITSDVGVPVFFATISPAVDGGERHWKHLDVSSGSGCHPSPARAAIRAITEAAQARVTSIAAARDDFDPGLYQAPLSRDLLTYPRAAPRVSRAYGHEQAGGPADILTFLLERLVSSGIGSVIVVPLEAGDRGFAVAKVLVPGLESLEGDRRRRFGKRALRMMVAAQ
jgi:YcaO-like protein with predicted kinase domain